MFTAADHAHMTQALRLAERGLYTTTPNPRVGCVIVKDEQVVGEGWHERAGLAHAEVNALQQAGESARGATVYVTLEPCSHHGRTPPCVDALIAAGVARVVFAMPDPNLKVNGLKALEAQGIKVESGLMAAQARELNIGFVSRMERGRPWVRCKMAASLDGGTALSNGVSQWITSEPARLDVQRWRARSCAILTGVGTLLADDPQMTVRAFEIGRQPLRVIVDSHLRTPPAAKMLQGGALIVCATLDEAQASALSEKGAEILVLPNPQGKVDLDALMRELATRGINELHVEGGSQLNGVLLELGLIDELLLYMAPVLLGGETRGMFDAPVLTEMAQRSALNIRELTHIGQDIRIRARFNESAG
ncbi:MAG: bifunctional diaminohydroxyphosphoribosylaminopyrimidine deaminase/5-amino-6-(5-phosphoribosylamino)uracil reductase RibD [Methylophilales bacterium]|nr:bifunctional diaminohydroxyphosphoribosylaminopyrimidine deaminase/5-amino-6-(5-phosphoribosylamino)uracil reductase RibD [Methylophilales bacterium]